MTRVTNFGLKRTYLEAGFHNDETLGKETALAPGGEQFPVRTHDPVTSSETAPPAKKKRKRTPKSKRDGNLSRDVAQDKNEATENDSLQRDTEEKSVESGATAPATRKSAKRNKRNKERRKKGKLFPEYGFLRI